MSMSFNTIGITVTPKEGDMFYLDFGLDNEDYAILQAPRTMNIFADVKKSVDF